MSLIKKGNGVVVIFAIALNLFCSSLNDVTGVCPMTTSAFDADSSASPCHGENGESSNESSSPCCSPEIADGISQPEFRIESESWFQFQVFAVLFSLPIEFVLEPIAQISFFNADFSFYRPDSKDSLSILQVFLI
ncbi:hypothetical protein [Leptospira barantonii]|uniref:Uncharacterized protein n=1 Tax=Leptospira barantonii TaxID=2023184 RepID=A0ABX4NH72_9LEPT|nr:hypothetical protein [Leptospira barantonii]PJZ56165.1 hypothetical protein CH367_17370 [Leptospira barantonii]